MTSPTGNNDPIFDTNENKTLVEMETIITALLPNSLKMSLTPAEIAFMTSLLADTSGNNSIVPQLQQEIQGILKEGSISLHDIPQLVLIITQIFQQVFSNKQPASDQIKNANINIVNLIQYTLDALLDSNILPIPAALQPVAKNILDTSITLLNTSLPTIEADCVAGCHECSNICSTNIFPCFAIH
jgi:hypothetical protein